MKRNDAVRVIANTLYEFNLEPEEADEEADKLLKKMEDLGMKPPKIENPRAKGLSSFVMQYESIPYYVHEWEEE